MLVRRHRWWNNIKQTLIQRLVFTWLHATHPINIQSTLAQSISFAPYEEYHTVRYGGIVEQGRHVLPMIICNVMLITLDPCISDGPTLLSWFVYRLIHIHVHHQVKTRGPANKKHLYNICTMLD